MAKIARTPEEIRDFMNQNLGGFIGRTRQFVKGVDETGMVPAFQRKGEGEGRMVPLAGKQFQTFQQRQRTFEDAGLITPEAMTTATTLPFQPTPQRTTFSIDDLTGLFDLGPTATEASDVGKRIRELQKQLIGKTAFEREEAERLGISGLRTQQEDLVSQIKALGIRSKQLEQEKALAAERIQQESIGRGRTAAGIAPLIAAAQRRITLEQADINSQALTQSAFLSAIEGKIGTSERLIEEAIKEKYGPIEEEIEILKFNLDIILESPDFDKEEKEEAQRIKDLQEERKRQLEIEKEDDKAKRKIAADAAAQGADIATIQQIQNAENQDEALRIAAEAGILTEKGIGQLTSERVGNFEILRDERGNVVSTRVIRGVEEPTDTDKKLSVSDIQRLQEQYPEAGIIFGDSEKEAQEKIENLTTELTEEEIKEAIKNARQGGLNKAQILDELTGDPRITNKNLATELINKEFGEEAKGDFFGGLFRTLFGT